MILRGEIKFPRAQSMYVMTGKKDGSRLTVRLMQRTYAGILDEIERQGYDPFRGRAFVSGRRKLAILGRALLRDWPHPGHLLREQSA